MSQSSGMVSRTLMFAAGILILFHLLATSILSGLPRSVLQTIVVMVAIMVMVLATTKLEFWSGRAQVCAYMAMLMFAIGINDHIVLMQNSLPRYWLWQFALSILLICLPFKLEARKAKSIHGRHHRRTLQG